MEAQVNDHTKRIASINPSSTRLISQSKEGIAHQQERLDSRDVTVIERSPEQIADPISELPAGSADIGGYFAELEAWTELGCAEVDGVQQNAGEVWATGSHISHEGWTICNHEGVVLSVPVEI